MVNFSLILSLAMCITGCIAEKQKFGSPSSETEGKKKKHPQQSGKFQEIYVPYTLLPKQGKMPCHVSTLVDGVPRCLPLPLR